MNQSRLAKEIIRAKSRGAMNVVWKPDPGDYTIRIVPYKHNSEWPFTEMWFYYRLMNKTIVSPITFGNPDPIKEFVDTLYLTGDPRDKELADFLKPKRRIYAPILVRGQEHAGVKFWGMAPSVYDNLILLMEDPDFGDITDPETGHDIKITIPKVKPGSFDGPSVRVRPKSSVVSEDDAVLRILGNMPNILEQWVEPSYDELKSILAQFADTNTVDDDEEVNQAPKVTKIGSVTKTSTVAAPDDEDDDVDDDAEEKPSVDVRKSFEKYFKK